MTQSGDNKKINDESGPQNGPRLKHFPISFFAMIMGLGGFTLALMQVENKAGMTHFLSGVMCLVVLALFIVLSLSYLAKFFSYNSEVIAEWKHPIKISMFPAITISMLILAICLKQSHFAPDLMSTLATIFWWAGAVLNFILTLLVLKSWMNDNHFQPDHMLPVWFIPVVGNILAPIGGATIAPVELNWFFFTVGFVSWLILLPLMMHRFFFGQVIPAPMRPSLFILIAPPAVAVLAYTALNLNQADVFATILYNTGLFFFLILISQVKQFVTAPFSLSWWGYSFPMAAITLASFKMGEMTGTSWFNSMGLILFGLLTLLILLLAIRTVLAAMAGKICVPH